MNDKIRRDFIDAMFEFYPRGRKLMYEAFDKLDESLTRTQQIILLVLDIDDNLSMSQLASRICTSNEQATRAVTQLVDKGLVTRAQNKTNRRVVNISITPKAKDYVVAAKKAVLNDTVSRAAKLSEQELKIIDDSIRSITEVIAKLDKTKVY